MNKRHYEHTLPNIRGSLSNTYFGGSCMENALTYDLFFFVERFYNNEFTQSTDYQTNRIR